MTAPRRSRQRGRKINGVILLNKPKGVSSNGALQQVKHLFNAQKAGHTGSLDPLATGMLPICFGEATKFSQFLLDADKQYQVTARLGIKTASGDSEGDILSQHDELAEKITLGDIEQALQSFRGLITQVPSMYSALKHNGQPLYKLARQGIEVPRKSREVTVYELNLTDYQQPFLLSLDIRCSKGTYVRSIVEDLGDKLGCGAHVVALHRSHSGPYQPEQMLELEQLQQLADQKQFDELNSLLLPLKSTISHWPEVKLQAKESFYLRQGQAISLAGAPKSGWVQLIDENNSFLGVAEVLADGKVAPRRLIA